MLGETVQANSIKLLLTFTIFLFLLGTRKRHVDDRLNNLMICPCYWSKGFFIAHFMNTSTKDST